MISELFDLAFRLAGFFCHQLPERSFFLLGPQATYSLDELWALGAVSEGSEFCDLRRKNDRIFCQYVVMATAAPASVATIA